MLKGSGVGFHNDDLVVARMQEKHKLLYPRATRAAEHLTSGVVLKVLGGSEAGAAVRRQLVQMHESWFDCNQHMPLAKQKQSPIAVRCS